MLQLSAIKSSVCSKYKKIEHFRIFVVLQVQLKLALTNVSRIRTNTLQIHCLVVQGRIARNRKEQLPANAPLPLRIIKAKWFQNVPCSLSTFRILDLKSFQCTEAVNNN
jgi:hypothetical protein